MAAKEKNFYQVVADAVRDIAKYGFDSEARVEYWVEQLSRAAKRETTSPEKLERMLKKGLASIYKRLVDNGGVLQRHKGIERFTLARVKPSLRSELDRRMMASASLIRSNREEAIQKTLHRFRGWATSIPVGGGTTDKSEASGDIRKSLSQLPFEERRVLIDQGHKLTSSLSDILARDGNALAAIWHSHWRQAGYNYREDHKERDLVVYALKGNWALEAGLMKAGKAGYYDDITSAGQEPFCRCYIEWVYHLSALPSNMLTEKGKKQLAVVRGIIRSDSVADAQDPRDPIRYEVQFNPETGEKRPYELWAFYQSGSKRRVASFGTEAAASERMSSSQKLFGLRSDTEERADGEA